MAVTTLACSGASEVFDGTVALDVPVAGIPSGGGGCEPRMAPSGARAAPGASGRPPKAPDTPDAADATCPAFIALSITSDAAPEASSVTLISAKQSGPPSVCAHGLKCHRMSAQWQGLEGTVKLEQQAKSTCISHVGIKLL